MLILTNPQFSELLRKKLNGRLPDKVQIECIELSYSMQSNVDNVLAMASREVSPAIIVASVEAEADLAEDLDGS